jgi:hypothetical protein
MGMGWRCGPGARWGGGFGWGRGWRHGYHATGAPFWARHAYASADYGPVGVQPTGEEEIAHLRSEAERLRQTLEAITDRIEELEQGEA